MNGKTKVFTSLVLSAAFLVTASGCSAKEDTLTTQLVAYIENPPEGSDSKFYITYDEWHSEYLFNMARGGYDEEKDADTAEAIKQTILEYLVKEHIILYLAEQEGVTAESLTDEERKEIDEVVQGIFDYWCSEYEEEAKEALGDSCTEEQLYEKEFELFTAYMEEVGLTPETFRVWETNEVIQDKFIKKTSENVTEQAAADLLQETIDAAKNAYENSLAMFEQIYTDYYVPEGTRVVQMIYVKINTDDIAEIQGYLSNGDNEKAEELLEAALETIRPTADEAHEKLQSGEDWLTVQEEYNRDGNGNNVDYVMYPASYYIPEDVIDAAMGIAEKGGVSDVIAYDMGYIILYYKDDRVLSNEELDRLLEQMMESLKTREFYNLVTEFQEQYPYVYDYELMGISRQ